MKQPLLHEILRDLLSSVTFPVDYTTATDNGDGTYTIGGICNLHYAQPGFIINIAGKEFIIKDYLPDGSKWKLVLENIIGNPLPSYPSSFNLYQPYFFHGTPMQQETELGNIPTPDLKTPMIYLMEPYDTEYNLDPISSIDSTSKFTLCFLTQADLANWLTDDFYHNAINPMVSLIREYIDVMVESGIFNEIIKAKPTYYTKFGINIRDLGTKKMYFAENLSGIGLNLSVDVYKIDDCGTCSAGARKTTCLEFDSIDGGGAFTIFENEINGGGS